MDRDSPIRALCDAHAIPVILYLDENGPRTKTKYTAPSAGTPTCPTSSGAWRPRAS